MKEIKKYPRTPHIEGSNIQEGDFDLNQIPFGQAWDELRKATKEIYVPSQCVECDLRNVCDQCAAICYAETGAFTNVPEYMCDRTKSYLAMMNRIL